MNKELMKMMDMKIENNKNSAEEQMMDAKNRFIEKQLTDLKYNELKESYVKSSDFKRLNPYDLFNEEYDYRIDQNHDQKVRSDLSKNLPLIDTKFNKHCPLARNQVYTFFSAPKNGKTSFASAISHGLYKTKEKVLVISNEEMKKDVLGRIAAIEIDMNYNSYILGKIDDPCRIEALEKKRQDISEYVKVISTEDADTLDADIICKIIEEAGDQGFSAIIIDYISKISRRSLVKIEQPWKAQEKLIEFIDSIRQRSDKEFPTIIVFSQIQQQNFKNPKPLKDRIEGRKLLPNISTGVYEIIKIKEASKTIIEIHCTRWYAGIDQWFFLFEKGKYISTDENDKESL